MRCRRRQQQTSRRSPEALHRGAHHFEPLEPRVHLTALSYAPYAEFFGFSAPVLSVAAPDGVASAGFGAGAAGLGDIDGDGAADFAVAAPGVVGGDGTPGVAGRVFVFSGATGSVIRSLTDTFAEFGASLAAVGDIDGDGVGDLLVGSPRFDADGRGPAGTRGAAYVYSGATGEVARAFLGSAAEADSGFGRAVAAAGDSNADGTPDVLVGAPEEMGVGRVYLLSGAESLVGPPGLEGLLRTFEGEVAGGRFGAAIAAGDLGTAPNFPGDGVRDVLIGAPGAGAEGEGERAHLFDGASGMLRVTFEGPEGERSGFGTAVAVRGEGIGAELLIGAPGAGAGGEGRVFRFDGAGAESGPALEGAAAGDGFGAAIRGVGDLDGDFVGDVAVSAPGAGGGSGGGALRSLSGATGRVLAVDPGFVGGGDVAVGAGDVDGDGVDEVIVASAEHGRALVYSSLAVLPLAITGVGELHEVFFNSDLSPGAAGRTRFAVIDGVFTPYSALAGIGDGAVVVGALGPGLLIGALIVPPMQFGEAPTLGEPFLVRDGVRVMLSAEAGTVVGTQTPRFENFRFVAVGINPDNRPVMVFNEAAPEGERERAWILEDGELRFLWFGTAADVNGDGGVVGMRLMRRGTGEEAAAPVMLIGDGQSLIVLPGLATAEAISESYFVAGLTPQGTLATWAGGTLQDYGLSALPEGAEPIGWRIIGFSSFTDLHAEYRYATGAGEERDLYVRTFTGLQPLAQFLFGPIPSVGEGGIGAALAAGPEGEVATRTGVLRRPEDNAHTRVAPGSPVHAASGGPGVVAYVSALGDIMVMRRAEPGVSWNAGRTSLMPIDPDAAGQTRVLTYTDPSDGASYLIAIVDGRTYWGRVTEPLGPVGVPAPLIEMTDLALAVGGGAEAIAGEATVLTTADGRVIIAGVSGAGDVVIYSQTGEADPSSADNWAFDNLVTGHLAPQGLAFEPVAGGLAAFATPWGSSHIAYLDGAGEVRVLWIGPGMELWSAVNLSAQVTNVEDPPALTGDLTAYVTPWQTLHVSGLDAGGFVHTIWWAPGFGGEWRAADLASEAVTGARPLAAGSLTSLVTPWGGLNIIGLDAETGEVTTYWWAPETNHWRVDALRGFEDETVRMTGRLAAAVSALGDVEIFGAAAEERDGQWSEGAPLWVRFSPFGGPYWSFNTLSEVI